MADVIQIPQTMAEVPTKQSMPFRSKLIDALLDIRLTLSIKKISSNIILKSELKKILDNTKQQTNDQKVSEAIDDVFSEYFKDQKKNVSVDSSSLSISDMEKLIDQNITFKEKPDAGLSYVKTDAHHKKSAETETEKAA